ncbi:hypothetical protein KIN20_005012 [Parelaphostrongylus tenuis]|uniref:THAP-type domain-containing protein n=1 Tax=Parelaphostrongylus tenuis TaxID=148309 RepID=A0AAD5QET6_PARTN|nr:hypothetical protein KIN20_005012 [Parelaphostrongylus tenuis]
MLVKERLGIDRAAHSSPCNSLRQQHQQHCGVIIDDVEDENEEEMYEEMEDEEEEEHDEDDDDDEVLDPTSSQPHHLDVDYGSPVSPRCLVCGQMSTPKTRLFKWPKDLQLRKSWLEFFHLSMDYLDSCKDPYICDTHFDADQFIYERDRVFWKRNPFPRFRQPCSILAEPSPGEMEGITTRKSNHPVQLNHRLANGQRVRFRESYFKSKSKSSHPVAIVSLPSNPDIFYEFSYTRTSSIDSSKFYSCLTCRRAKAETRINDVIRTIHIKDGIIRSRGDPFLGHHVACRPFAKAHPIHQEDSCGYVKYPRSMNLNEDRQWSSISKPPEQKYSVGGSKPPLRTSRMWFVKQPRKARSLPRCHLCLRVLSSTQLLVEHLLQHMKSTPNCRICSSKMSPDEHVRLRRVKICSKCHEKA